MSASPRRRRAGTAIAAGGAGLALVLVLHPGKKAAIEPRAASKVTSPSSTTVPPSSTPQNPSVSGTTVAQRSATGRAENYGYGTLTVSVTVHGRHIAGVSVVHLQTIDPYSQSLAKYAIPMLKREVLNAQSANIQGVSGATYTSEAYAYSLQAALNQLGVQ